MRVHGTDVGVHEEMSPLLILYGLKSAAQVTHGLLSAGGGGWTKRYTLRALAVKRKWHASHD